MRIKHWFWAIGGLLLVVSGLLVAAPSHSQEDEGENIHKNVLQSYEGPQTCLMCHPADGQEVAESVHYTMYAPRTNLVGSEEIEAVGMATMYCGLPSTVLDINWLGLLQPQDSSLPAQPGGCAKCHITTGPRPNVIEQQTAADYANVDCLMCHGPDYARTVVKEDDVLKFAPAEGVDILAVAQNVGTPTDEMCLRCHAGAGGALNAKHGVIPTAASDVHTAAGLQCVDCHTTVDHKIAGGSDVKAQDPVETQLACTNCHTDLHQESVVGDRLNAHTEYVACQSCHIPTIARDPDMPTVVYRDYAEPVLNAATGLYGPTNEWASEVIPDYLWWNRGVTEPPGPDGTRADGMLMPWKEIVVNVPVDAATGDAVPMKLGPYYITGKLIAGVTQGVSAMQALDVAYEFSGTFDMEEEILRFAVNHQVAPAEDAVKCGECHSRDQRLDWAELGYTREEINYLGSFGP